MAIQDVIASITDDVRANSPLVHCITNYVTVESCANAVLAIGASPIMSDEVDDVRDIQTICGGLDINIGTLNKNTIAGMKAAGARAAEVGHPIVLDPVGAGASALRTATSSELLDTLPIAIVRGNMSEVKALAGSSAATKGVDVNPDDAVTDANLAASAAFAKDFAAKAGCVVAITGAIDIVADATTAYAVRNGSPKQGCITGAGCMLSAMTGAYAVCGEGRMLEAALAAVVHMGLAGQVAAARMSGQDGTGSFHTYLMDALSNITGADIAAGALVEEVR